MFMCTPFCTACVEFLQRKHGRGIPSVLSSSDFLFYESFRVGAMPMEVMCVCVFGGGVRRVGEKRV